MAFLGRLLIKTLAKKILVIVIRKVAKFCISVLEESPHSTIDKKNKNNIHRKIDEKKEFAID